MQEVMPQRSEDGIKVLFKCSYIEAINVSIFRANSVWMDRDMYVGRLSLKP